MTGLIKLTDIHTGKHTMHLIKQQHFDESHIHLCNIKMSTRDTHTHTRGTCLLCVLQEITADRLQEKRERDGGRERHIHGIQAFRGRGLELMHSAATSVT